MTVTMRGVVTRNRASILCPECGIGTILTGRQAQYNAVIVVDGKNTQVCANCAILDFWIQFKNGTNKASRGMEGDIR